MNEIENKSTNEKKGFLEEFLKKIKTFISWIDK